MSPKKVNTIAAPAARKRTPTVAGPQPRTIALLGPQGATPDVGAVLGELGIRGPVAIVRAGYQENEGDDGELVAALGVPAVNLALHARSNVIFKTALEFTVAYQARQQRLRHLQSFYRVRLDATDEGARKISLRYIEPELIAQEEKVSVDLFRHVDRDHLERCQAVHAQFNAAWPHDAVPQIARQRTEIREAMAGCEALVIAGGHVASLLNRLQLLDVIAANGDKPIVAWSAGAMVLAERIVLFHDFPPYGSDIAQVLDAGFGLVPAHVILPDARRRIDLGAQAGIQRFSRRMAPATCVAMDHGARMVFERGELRSAHAVRLTTAGEAERNWTGEPTRSSTLNLGGVHV